MELIQIFLAELLGTGMLMFMGCSGGLTWGLPLNHLMAILNFGLVLMIVIMIFGSISSTHLNPAVSLTALIAKKITAKMAVVYMAAQMIGGFMGFGLLAVVAPTKQFAPEGAVHGHCASVINPEVPLLTAVFIEFIATFILCLIVCSLWDPRNAHTHESVSLRFGLAICALVFSFVSIIWIYYF